MLNSILDDQVSLKQGEEVIIPIEFQKADEETSKVAMLLNGYTDYDKFETFFYDKVFDAIKKVYTNDYFQQYLPGNVIDISLTDNMLMIHLTLDRNIVRLSYPCPLSVAYDIRQMNHDWYSFFWKTYGAFPVISGIHKVFLDENGNLFVLELYRLEFVINDAYVDFIANSCIHYDSKYPNRIIVFSEALDENFSKIASSLEFEVEFNAFN